MQEYRDQPGTVGEILIPFCICSRAQSTAIVAFMESSYAFNEYGLRSQWSLGKRPLGRGAVHSFTECSCAYCHAGPRDKTD